MFKSAEMKATITAYMRFFDTEDGKLILKDLMKSCHFMSSTMGNDPHETSFNEGARSVVVRILKTTNTDIKQLDKFIAQMETEEHEL